MNKKDKKNIYLLTLANIYTTICMCMLMEANGGNQ